MYFQNDRRWSHLHWYSPVHDELVRKLTEALHKVPDSQAVFGSDKGTLGNDGCWHTALSSMLKRFEIQFDGKPCNPKSFLYELRRRMLGTLSGYVEHPFVDPISMVTDGKVQLLRYRDFLQKGATSEHPDMRSLLADVDGKAVCAIANVQEHEFFGKSDNPHYVLVIERSGATFRIHDPGWPKYKKLFSKRYPRVYQLFLYRRYD